MFWKAQGSQVCVSVVSALKCCARTVTRGNLFQSFSVQKKNEQKEITGFIESCHAYRDHITFHNSQVWLQVVEKKCLHILIKENNTGVIPHILWQICSLGSWDSWEDSDVWQTFFLFIPKGNFNFELSLWIVLLMQIMYTATAVCSTGYEICQLL